MKQSKQSREEIEVMAYTVDEACQAARISRASLYRAIRNGELPLRKHGARSLILMQDLCDFVRSRPIQLPRR
jgi:excisionase family DNA binding protein